MQFGLVVVGVWVVWASITLVLALVHARAAEREVERARSTPPANLLTATPVVALQKARSEFADADDWLGSAALAPIRLMPVVGRQLRSIEHSTAAGSAIAGISSGALSDAQALASGPHSTGPERVELLRGMARIAEATATRLDHLPLGPAKALMWPAAEVRDRLQSQYTKLVTGLRKGAAGATATADVLQGPRRYVVLAANNAEMRAGSGMFLGVGVLETSEGALHFSDFLPTETLQLPPGSVPLEGDLAARWGWLKPNEDWRNLGVSPRFDVTAPLAARMWEARGGGQVDGVFAVDVEALRDILAAVGPIQVAGAQVDADNAVDLLLHGQYVAHKDDPDKGARREELGEAAKTTLAALQDRPWNVGLLGQELARAGRGRHIMAWANAPGEQAGWLAAGIDGALDSDSLLVGVLNRGANKLDHFLSVSASISLRHSGGKTLGEIHVALRNEVPEGEPREVAGPWSDAVPRDAYVGILAVSLPAEARDARVDGVAQLVAAGSDGPTRVVAAAVSLARGQSRTLVVRFELSGRRNSLTIRPSGRVPAVAWKSGGGTWRDESPHTVRW